MRDGSGSEPMVPGTVAALSRAQGEIDVRDVLSRLRRRKWTILGTSLLLTIIAAVITFQLTPRYRAEAQVMIDARHNRVVNVDEVLSGLTGERETIESERRVIGSRALAEKVIARLQLGRLPEFDPALRPPHPLMQLLNEAVLLSGEFSEGAGIPGFFGDLVSAVWSDSPRPPDEIAEARRARIVDTFLDKLEVLPDGRSRVLTISFVSEQPELAAKIANTIAEFYLVDQLEAKYEATRLASEWLTDRTAEMREKVKASEDAVEAFRRQAGLLEGKGVTLASQQVAELNTQLILARGTRAETEARLRQVQALLTEGAGPESAAEVLSAPTIVRLKEQEAEVTRRAAELGTQYGPKHPRIINVHAELADIKGKLEAEVQKIVQSFRNEAAVARARETSLAAGLEALKGNVGRANSAEVRLRALEREANANRALFENFLTRLKETTAQQDLQRPDARLISRADLPDRPAYPRKKLVLACALFLSLITALALAFLLERLDAGFRSADQVEGLFGVPGLGLIPLLSGGRRRGKRPERYVLSRPASALAESLRTLHTALLFSDIMRPPRTVLITSSVPREGKSTIALAWSRLMAKAGRRVLLIDADLRHPRVGSALQLSRGPGLADTLQQSVSWRDTVQRDIETGLDVIVAGESTLSPTDLLASPAMSQLLSEAGAEYDLVLLDSPPVVPVSDSRILASLVDKTVFVIRWASTPRAVCDYGIKHLREAGGSLAGAVLSMVNVREHARYSYGDSGAYYGASRKYYVN